MEKLLTLQEAAERLGIKGDNARVTIYRKVKAKLLRAYKPAGRLMFKAKDVESYLNKTVVR